jgi:hypothetical protein
MKNHKEDKMKWLLALISSLIIGLTFVAQSDGKIDVKDVAGVWLYNEGEGNIVKDYSGNENHGKFVGTPEWVEEGVFGAALDLRNQGHVVVEDSDSLDMPEAWTLVTWVKMNPPMERYQHIINKRFDIEANYVLRLENTGVWRTFYNNGGWPGLWDPSPAKGGEWVHLAVTYDGKSFMALYVDGEVVISNNVGGPPPTNDLPLRLGSYNQGGKMDGMLDDTAIFSVVLTQEEIKEIKEKGLEFVFFLAVEPSGKLPAFWGYIKALNW